MWYFLIKQHHLYTAQFLTLQQQTSLTEIELFNEPYENWYIFTVQNYHPFMDHLDREGITYELTASRPTRDDMLARMR